MSRSLLMPSEDLIQQTVAWSERVLPAQEFLAAASDPLTADEQERYHELIAWFSRRYPTAADRLAYVRRTMARIAHAPSLAKALLVEAYVTSGGRKAAPQDPGAVRVCLMNVLRFTATDIATRFDLLRETIRQVGTGPTILLTPGGYFGHDSLNGQGRTTLAAGLLDRQEVIRRLRHDLSLPEGLLLAVGVDHADRQTFLLIERGNFREIVREQTSVHDRCYPFAGLKLFGLICGEFRDFDVRRDILGQGVDVVLDAAHIEVKCRQRSDVALNRFPFERFFIDVSRAGAACFLAHHHPGSVWQKDVPKNHSYSNWGIYRGSGADDDWLPLQTPITPITPRH